MDISIFILLIVFQLKHLVADYYLQFPYMYLNKGKKTGWIQPLFDHSAVHAVMTLVILVIYSMYINKENELDGLIALLGGFDFVTHFVTDRWKATRGRTPDQPKFWYDLGIDQSIHHIVGIIIIFMVTLWTV